MYGRSDILTFALALTAYAIYAIIAVDRFTTYYLTTGS